MERYMWKQLICGLLTVVSAYSTGIGESILILKTQQLFYIAVIV